MSSALEDLIRRWPLTKFNAEEMLAAGDLEMLSIRYRKVAGDQGYAGEWWGVWLEIQRRRGLALRPAAEELTGERRRFLVWWLLYRDRLDEALEVSAIDGGPGGDLVEALITRGRLDDAVRAAGVSPPLVARALARSGRAHEARAAWTEILDRHHWEGGVWATVALLEAALGNEIAARAALLESAKRGGGDQETIADVLARLGVPAHRWQAMLDQHRYLPDDCDERTQRHLADPGARLVPSGEESRHWFGGTALTMAPCGCGHPLRQWFVIDLRALPHLAARLPGWVLFPLLGCADCDARISRSDYQMTADGRGVILLNQSIPGSWSEIGHEGRPRERWPELTQQWARLEPNQAIVDADPDDDLPPAAPQVGGTPRWIQQPERLFCKQCRGEMTFVAALAGTGEFDVSVVVNNASGYQYHFACPACRTITVLPQHT